MPTDAKRCWGRRLYGVVHRLNAWLWRMPALMTLIPFALGIFWQNEQRANNLGLLPLGIAAFIMALALIIPPYRATGADKQTKPKLRQRLLGLRTLVFSLGFTLSLISMGLLRQDYAQAAKQSSFKPVKSPTKERLNEALKAEGVQAEYTSLLSALSLGYLPRSQENMQMRQNFVRSGVAHLLVVSGYHLALVVLLLGALLSKLKRHSPSVYYLLLIISAWVFTALSGWGLPSVRAAIMFSLYFVGRMIGRSIYVPNILAASAFIQLVYDPNALYSWGLWLSYTAVFSIYLFYTPIKKSIGTVKQPILSYLWDLLSLSLSAQVLLAPLLLYLFHSYSWAFIIITLPLSLLCSLLIPLALLAYTLLSLSLPISVLADILNLLSYVTVVISEWTANLPFITVEYNLPLWALLLAWGLSGYGLSLYWRYNPRNPRLKSLDTLTRNSSE